MHLAQLIRCTPLLMASNAWAATPTLADTVEKVLDGVVNIRTRDNTIATNAPQTQTLEKYFGFLLGPGNNTPQNSQSSGSGFFYKSRKFIVTNWHVVKDSKTITIATSRKYLPLTARVLGHDERSDLAVLAVDEEATTGPVLRFGSASRVRLGETVFAIGNPFGYGHTVTSGILSAKDRTIGAGPLNDFLQTDAPINPGNSGGPLFDTRGEVIGINTAIAPEARGISFAIPSEIAKPILDELILTGSFRRPWIGAYVSELAEQSSGTTNHFGIYVYKVLEKSPAEKAGILSGDIILGVNSQKIREIVDFQNIMSKTKPGNKLSISIFRNNSAIRLSLIPDLIPPNQGKTDNYNEY
jgi:serine protease Do